MNIIEIKNLNFQYTKKDVAIKNVSLSIGKGEFVCILGHNGSGKSTLAKLIAGLLAAKSGEIYVNGILINEKTINVVGIDNEVIVTVDGQSKSYGYLFKEPFYNTILITNKEIKMIDASCKNHDCMRMQMNPLFHTPIVCTNGIIVKMVSRDIEIIS